VRREQSPGKQESRRKTKRGFPLVTSRTCLGKDLDCCGSNADGTGGLLDVAVAVGARESSSQLLGVDIKGSHNSGLVLIALPS